MGRKRKPNCYLPEDREAMGWHKLPARQQLILLRKQDTILRRRRRSSPDRLD